MKSLDRYKKRQTTSKVDSNRVINARQDFEYELSLIHDNYFREFARFVLNNAPQEFYTYPASKTSMHHPSFCNEMYGLTRHVKLCVRIAYCLMKDGLIYSFDEVEQDMVIVALLLHDICKFGGNGYKNFNKHGRIAIHYIEDLIKGSEFESFAFSEAWEIISKAITLHMGKFGCQDYGIPDDKISIFVSHVDLISSLKCYDEIIKIKELELG